MNWTDLHVRDAFFNEALDSATKVLVITGVLVMYLDDRDVIALLEAITLPEVTWWMSDFAGPVLKKMMNKKMADILSHASFNCAPENGLFYFEDFGWCLAEAESLCAAAHRFHRLPSRSCACLLATSTGSASSW